MSMSMRSSSNQPRDEHKGYLAACVANPSSPRRLVWDLISIVVIFYDLIMIPLAVFEMQETPFTEGMVVFTATFWLLDMVGSFFVGHYSQGVLEMRPAFIARHYLKGWFFLDLVLVMIDWMLIVSGSNRKFLALFRMGKSMRFARLLKVLRLIRVIKVLFILQELTDTVNSELFTASVTMLRLVFALVFVNHYIGCLWYLISVRCSEGGLEAWIDKLKLEDKGETKAYQYLTAVHWSVTQFTPASMEVVPQNALERLYTILVIFFAVITFSSFLTSLTQIAIFIRNWHGARQRQRLEVQKYMQSKSVSRDVIRRVFTFMDNSRPWKVYVQFDMISSFQALPGSLRTLLRDEVFRPVLVEDPFFQHLYRNDPESIIKICNLAVIEVGLLRDQELFIRNEPAKGMYFAIGGTMLYFLWDSAGENHNDGLAFVPGETACDMALWVKWHHKGRLVAAGPSEVVKIDIQTFLLLCCGASSFGVCRSFARRILRVVQSTRGMHDLWCDRDACRDLAVEVFSIAEVGPGSGSLDSDEAEDERMADRTTIAQTMSATVSRNVSSVYASWRNAYGRRSSQKA